MWVGVSAKVYVPYFQPLMANEINLKNGNWLLFKSKEKQDCLKIYRASGSL